MMAQSGTEWQPCGTGRLKILRIWGEITHFDTSAICVKMWVGVKEV